MLKVRLASVLSLSLALAVGCSSSETPGIISGRVTYRGEPVPGGMIFFISEGKAPRSGALGPDGSYRVEDLPEGEMVVTVETESLNPKNKTRAYGGAKGEKVHAKRREMEAKMKESKGDQGPPPEYRKIPRVYADPKTSPLRVTIVAGRQEENFDLTD